MLAQSNLLDKYQKELTDYDQVRLPHTLIANDGMKLGEVMRTLNSEMICPICLDLLQETTVTECLHRFCAKCISNAIYKSNRECPTCRKKLISKRNLRADPNMDLLISAIWPDRAVYEQMQDEQAQKWSVQSNAQTLQKSIAEGIKEQAMARKHAPSPLVVENLANVDEAFAVQPKKALGRPRKFPMPLTVGQTVQKQQLLPSTSKTPSTSMPMDVDFSSDESDSDFSSSDLSTSSAMDISSADESVEDGMKQFDQLALPEELKQIHEMTSPKNLKQFTQLKTPQNLKQFTQLKTPQNLKQLTQLITPEDLKLKQFNQLKTPPNDFRGSKATDFHFGEDSPQPKKTKLLRDFSLTPSPMHNKSNILVNATAKSKQSSPKTAIPLLDFSNSSDSSGYQSFSSQGNQQSTKLESMENFVQNYKEQGLMGIVTLVLQPLPRALGGKMLARGSPMKNLRNSRVCLPHTSTVGELSLKIADDILPVSPQQQQCCSSSAPPMDLSAQIRFFIQTPLKQLVELYPPDSICTVLALGDRANLYSFPTVYFSVAK